MPVLTIMLLFSSFLPVLLTSIFGNFLAFHIKQVSRADLPGDKEGFVPLFSLDALSCSLAATLAARRCRCGATASVRDAEGPASPQLQPCARALLRQLPEWSHLPWLQAGIPLDHTPSTTGNCSGYYCNTTRNVHVSSAREPKLPNHRDSALTPPALDVVCSNQPPSYFILALYYNCFACTSL